MEMMLHAPDPPLRHGELTLRQWRVTDIGALVRACADVEIVRWTPVPAQYADSDAAAYVARSDALWSAGAGAGFAIVGTATDELLGAVELKVRSIGRATVGFWLARDARGHGVATRALRLVSDWAFRTIDVRRIELATDPRNTPSLGVAERAGFAREGLRRRAVRLNGERRDSVLFALAREAA